MKTFKEDNRISLNDKVEADDDEAEPFLVGDETHKQMLYTQEATTRTHYARLVKYVRLIDYMLMDSKLSLINNSVSHALEIVREDFSNDRKIILRNKIQSWPLFEIEWSFVRELYYTPSMYDLRDAIKNAVSEGIQLVCINEQFLHSLEFISKAYNNQDYEEKVAGEFNDLINLAISSETIRNNCQNIYDQIEFSFNNIIEYARNFQKYIDFYLENNKTDWTQYQDHEAFRKAINEHLRQEDEIERFVPITDILIYRLNANNLRNDIRPSPGKCLVQIRDYMPKLSYQKLESLWSELDEANILLSRIPKNINEFVDIMKYLWKMDSWIDDFTDRFQQIEQLHIVMDEYKVKFPEKNKSKFKDTHAALKSVRTKLEEGLQAGEANEVRFKKELDKEIPKLEQRISAWNSDLNNPELDNRNTRIQTAIDLVNLLELEVNSIRDKGKLVNEQQRFLEINEVYFESIDTLVNTFTLKKKLWYGLKKMIAYSEEWK